MNGNEDCRAYVAHLRLEHSHIDQSLVELQHLIDETIRARMFSAEILPRLTQLREQLVHHFREEEDGGCLEEALSRSPRLGTDVRILLDEHSQFVKSLDDLILQAKRLGLEPQKLEKLHNDFTPFVHALHEHEAEESRVLVAGFGSLALE
jgi:hypothetical protein